MTVPWKPSYSQVVLGVRPRVMELGDIGLVRVIDVLESTHVSMDDQGRFSLGGYVTQEHYEIDPRLRNSHA